MKISFLLLVLMLLPYTVSAEIYKWVDKDGNVHFGDRADHSDAVELNIKGQADKRMATDKNSDDEGLTREEKRQRILDAMNEDREERNRLKEEEREQQKNKKIQCARLKDKLRNVKRATGLYNLDENGNRVFLSNKDRSKSENSLRKAIDKNCR